MKPRALIIPAAIRSHVLPSLYLADLLADEYEVHYAVTSQVLSEISGEEWLPSSDEFRA